ncbi:MAG: glycosyltransferase [Microcoleaceae cyanobacterium]
MKLSCCMIVKNEADRLPGCLRSIQNIVDEIIILDTGSTDNTLEIAAASGAKVYTESWCNDFAASRNQALQYVTGDWVLVLDADEHFVVERAEQLKQAILQEDVLVINLIRQEVGAIQSPYSLVSRLFRNHPKILFSRPYHALIDDSVIQLLSEEPNWKILTLSEVAILHQGYQTDIINQQKKYKTAQIVMEQYYAQHPDDPYVASKLGGLYIEIGQIAQGILVLEQGLSHLKADSDSDISTDQVASILYEFHYHLGIGYRKQQNLTQSLYHYQAATQIDLLPALKLGAYNNLGNLFKETGNLIEAKTAYQNILHIDPSLAIAHYNLGMTLRAMGKYSEAIAAYRQAIVLNPEAAEAYQNLGVVLLQIGQVLESREAFKHAIVLHEQNHSVEAQRLRQALQAMGLKIEIE